MDIDESQLDVVQEVTEERPVPCEFITGAAGTGKTFGAMQAAAADPSWGLLTSTTGISAVNLGGITIHSTLKYSDTRSLWDNYISGRLMPLLHVIALKYRRLLVDEASMADGDQLDVWYRAAQAASRYKDVKEPLGLTLIGDFAQLPPVNAKWAFEANCWDKFRDNTTVLTKMWRQTDGAFLNALNLARRGLGSASADAFAQAGAKFEDQVDQDFEGTTIYGQNEKVSKFNTGRLDRLPGQEFFVRGARWGQQRPDWGENPRSHEWGIPPAIRLKIGAYVMLLANDNPDFTYVNGDCGWVRESTPVGVMIELVRTKEEVFVTPIVRDQFLESRPDGWTGIRIPPSEDEGAYIPEPHYRGRAKRFVTGQIKYLPVRLAYATTVHKSQSLTLDRVQVEYRDWFFSKPAMLYVALSRCRTLEGLRLVGMKEKFVKQCQFDPKVKEWL